MEKVWQAPGMSGFLVYKFALKRCPGQPSLTAVCNIDDEDASGPDEASREVQNSEEQVGGNQT